MKALKGRGAVSEALVFLGAPGRSRTCDPRIRSPMLYPTELQARQVLTIHERRANWRGASYGLVRWLRVSACGVRSKFGSREW
jgi:hypothetical protein